jgi:amidophosphoribosyltransferase
MATDLGCDSLRYLPIESVARAIGIGKDGLCQACISTEYPTSTGERLYQLDREGFVRGKTTGNGRAYDVAKT